MWPNLAAITCVHGRVESGLHLLNHLTHRTIQMWPTYDPHKTHLWPTCWSFLFKSNVTWHEKFLIQNNAIDFLIFDGIQNLSLAQTSWRWNLWTPHASKQLEIINWFYTNDIFQCIHQTQSSITYQMTTLFLKNMWYPGHIQIRNLAGLWMRPI